MPTSIRAPCRFSSIVAEGTQQPDETNAMEWSSAPLAPGTYTVQMQANYELAHGFRLPVWHLTVERVKI